MTSSPAPSKPSSPELSREEFEAQVRVEMAVTDLPWCDVVCLVGGQRFAGPFRVKRDLRLEDRILTDLEAFHHRVIVRGLDPDPDATEAYRCRTTSPKPARPPTGESNSM